MSAIVRGLGLVLPAKVRRNDEWPPSFRERFGELRPNDLTRVDPEADAIGAIATRYAAVDERDPFRGATQRFVVAGESASELGARAARAALDDAKLSAADVDLVLGHSLVPDRVSPPDAPRIAGLLGIERAAAVAVDAVCASVVAQLVLGAAMIESGRSRTVLLVQSHVVSPTLDYEQPASAIFGDAASALVLGRGPEGTGLVCDVASVDGLQHDAVTFVRKEGTAWHQAGGRLHPGSADRTATGRLTSRLVHHGVETMRALFARAHVDPSMIDVLAAIQPTAWYPPALAEACGVPKERAPTTFATIAHVGACGVVANLLEARARGMLVSGALVALYGHGAGLNRLGALVRWTEGPRQS